VAEHPDFADLLRRHRIAAALTQEDLAERAQLSVRAISDLERGEHLHPRPETVQLLIRSLGLSEANRSEFVSASQRSGQQREATPSNLPILTLSFVGREHDVLVLETLLRQPEIRLINLTGPAGVGKTRLAIEVASRALSDFSDGVFFVALAAIRDPEIVPSVVAQVLGVQKAGTGAQPKDVADFLRPRTCLLVCDNFEQVLSAGVFLADLLAAAPHLKILVTSRSVLHLRDEHEFLVPPLELPRASSPARLRDLTEDIIEYGAVHLFVERARNIHPDFTLTREDAPIAAEICWRLDGLPLAIELATARLRLLPPRALLARLEPRLPLLTGGSRDLPARQQTLRAAITWSVDLLTDDARILFRRLAVFVGSFTFKAAEEVVGGDVDLLNGLETLVASNLLRVRDWHADEPRFTWLETIREFAAELLLKSGEVALTRDRHARWCLRLVDSVSHALLPSIAADLLARLDDEYDNLHAALDWLRESGDTERSLRFGAGIWPIWYYRGYEAGGQLRLESLLELPGAANYPSATARIHTAAGFIGFLHGDFARAEAEYMKTIAFARETGDQAQLMDALALLGISLRDHGDFARAGPHLKESLAIARATNDRGRLAWVLQQRGIVAREEGDLPRARALLEESAAINRNLGATEAIIAVNALNLALVAEDERDENNALSSYRECLVAASRVSFVYIVAFALEGFAGLAARADQAIRALRIVGAAERLRHETHMPLPPMMQGRLDRTLELAHRPLAPAVADAALADGRAMAWQEATALALAKETQG
jgi:predicted ATPase/DNA-binding XRE family transcriptional regulator